MRRHVRHIRHSLSMKLSLGILLLTVLVFVVSLGIFFQQSRHHIKLVAMERATSELEATSQRVSRFLRTVETATNSNAWLVLERLQPESLLTISHNIVLFNANVNGCSITTEPYLFPAYGRYFSAYSVREGDSIATVHEGEYEYFEKEWYKAPKRLGKACWTDPFDDNNEGTLSSPDMIASYCKPLFDGEGKFIGVISSNLSLKRLSEVIQADKPYPNAYFVLLGEDGHYYVHPDAERLFDKTIFSDVNIRQNADVIALGHEMISGHKGSMRVKLGGAYCLVCYMPVEGTSWSLGLVCPDSDILHSYNQLTYIIVPLIIIGLMLILLLCRKIVTHAVRPLNRLVEQSQRIAEGHYDEQIPQSRREDVVGMLQNSFARMKDSLQRHINDIVQVNTEMLSRNEELQKATSQAEEAVRQKEAFIQNMTHQIRTPLNIVMGFAQVMRDNSGELTAEETKSITDMMNHNTHSLGRMVAMLYDCSDAALAEELRSHKHDVVACNELARECMAQVAKQTPHANLDFETSLTDTTCIHTNRMYLKHSMLELLYNATKYSDGKHLLLQLTETVDGVRIVFQDTGPGIPEDYRELMFEMFTKVNDLSEGLGLGLPLSKRHIDNLGGRLWLDTTYHEGCRIIIELPTVS